MTTINHSYDSQDKKMFAAITDVLKFMRLVASGALAGICIVGTVIQILQLISIITPAWYMDYKILIDYTAPIMGSLTVILLKIKHFI